ncbi:MAG: FAD-dependent oxidoreductase, partial [Notoacmeibacter sp.]
MAEYSAWTLLKNAFNGNKDWPEVWRKPEPKPNYDVIIIGGGGHGLSTAYYLAKEFGLRNVAVVEKGVLGQGNVGRNTQAIRSNYLLPENQHFYELCMDMWEGLSQELNYNVMFSQRGVLNIAHHPAQLDQFARRGNAMRLNGLDADLYSRADVAKALPGIDMDLKARFPIYGGLMQKSAGVARHDAVAWGY